MDGRPQGIKKAIIAVRREINRQLRLWRDGAGYFDVEHDFAVGALRVARGAVVATVH